VLDLSRQAASAGRAQQRAAPARASFVRTQKKRERAVKFLNFNVALFFIMRVKFYYIGILRVRIFSIGIFAVRIFGTLIFAVQILRSGIFRIIFFDIGIFCSRSICARIFAIRIFAN